MSGIQRGLAFAGLYTRKTPSEACNNAGYLVTNEAIRLMPFVTVPVIDTQLAVLTTPKIGVRGKPLKNKKNFFGKVGTSAKSAEVPLAVLIIAARSRPGSNYNALTNSRYALPSWPFKGISKQAGAWLMASLVHKMIAARHKSGSFLKAGWLPASNKLKPFRSRKYQSSQGTFTILESEGTTFFRNNLLGDAIPAQAGGLSVSCTIENDVGMDGQNAASFNHALHLYGAPGLQQAVDTVGEREMQYFLDKSAKEELEGPVNKAWG